jgi:hypothetical protein
MRFAQAHGDGRRLTAQQGPIPNGRHTASAALSAVPLDDVSGRPVADRRFPNLAWPLAQPERGRLHAPTQLKRLGIEDAGRPERRVPAMGARAGLRLSPETAPPVPARAPAAAVVQRAVNDDLAGLEHAYQTTNDPLLKKILAEARTLSDIEFSDDNDPEQAHAARQQAGDLRAHEVNIDPRIEGAVRRQSLVLHEMIHVSADRRYNANRIGEPDAALTAVLPPNLSNKEQLAEIGRQARHRYAIAEKLMGRVDGDGKLSKDTRVMVKDRLSRITGASHREFDTVASELYYVLKMQGADERSPTFRTIRAMAQGAYTSRTEGRPLDEVYEEPAEEDEKPGCVVM